MKWIGIEARTRANRPEVDDGNVSVATTGKSLVIDIKDFSEIKVKQLFDIIEGKLFLGFTCHFFCLCLVHKLFF